MGELLSAIQQNKVYTSQLKGALVQKKEGLENLQLKLRKAERQLELKTEELEAT